MYLCHIHLDTIHTFYHVFHSSTDQCDLALHGQQVLVHAVNAILYDLYVVAHRQDTVQDLFNVFPNTLDILHYFVYVFTHNKHIFFDYLK